MHWSSRRPWRFKFGLFLGDKIWWLKLNVALRTLILYLSTLVEVTFHIGNIQMCQAPCTLKVLPSRAKKKCHKFRAGPQSCIITWQCVCMRIPLWHWITIQYSWLWITTAHSVRNMWSHSALKGQIISQLCRYREGSISCFVCSILVQWQYHAYNLWFYCCVSFRCKST